MPSHVRLDFSRTDRVYVDAVFLIATEFAKPEVKVRADSMWMNLVARRVKVCVSPLTIRTHSRPP
jgi:hypothetical protein